MDSTSFMKNDVGAANGNTKLENLLKVSQKKQKD